MVNTKTKKIKKSGGAKTSKKNGILLNKILKDELTKHKEEYVREKFNKVVKKEKDKQKAKEEKQKKQEKKRQEKGIKTKQEEINRKILIFAMITPIFIIASKGINNLYNFGKYVSNIKDFDKTI